MGPAVPVLPDGESGNLWYMSPLAVTAEGRVAVGWTVGDDRGRGQHRMRWIDADGTAGPAIDLGGRMRDATELTLETAGDRAVAIVDDGGKVTAQDILPDATVGPRRTLLDARYTHSSSTSNGEKVAVVVQGITGERSSIHVIERAGLNWRKPVRLARGGPLELASQPVDRTELARTGRRRLQRLDGAADHRRTGRARRRKPLSPIFSPS